VAPAVVQRSGETISSREVEDALVNPVESNLVLMLVAVQA
jgi:hypothetical protein